MTDSTHCNCCEGVSPLTPAPLENLPGQAALAYRVGTQARFKESMKAAISRQPALGDLTTRDDNDPSLALIDAWATTLDVLTFYQERIANEGFLRTATERGSLLELARSIGYELRPGVAASTYLAFELESAPGSPEKVTLSIGTKAQTVPGQDELPQTFETVEAIEARPEWNKLKAKTTKELLPVFDSQQIYLQGVTTQLKPGDGLLIVGQERQDDPETERWDFRQVTKITPDNVSNTTRVEWAKGLGWARPYRKGKILPAQKNVGVYAFRQRAALFGHNAPDWRVMPDSIKKNYITKYEKAKEWPDFTIRKIANKANTIYLDALYPAIVPSPLDTAIVPKTWLVLSSPKYEEVYEVKAVAEDSRQNFSLSSKTTCVTLSGENLLEKFDNAVRETVVYAVSEELTIVEAPDISDITSGDDRITVDMPDQKSAEKLAGLGKGRTLIVSGLNKKDEPANEVVQFDSIDPKDRNCLVFQGKLKNTYKRDSVVIHANVAAATHGETKTEVLGSGDASQAFQKFTLKQSPLTYTATGQVSSGAITTLVLRVNDVAWEETPSLYGLKRRDSKYITRLADDGKVTVEFGDGQSGARLPSGAENVQAAYRIGTGLAGMVKAGQISLLMTRPLGVKGVVNPIAPQGAQDAETRDQARQNAPLTVLTLDRIVSLQDFEDFARAFGGIGKAQARSLWDGQRDIVHITVASADGKTVPDDSLLRSAIELACDPTQRFVIDTFEPLTFTVEVKVKIDPDYLTDKVIAAIKKRMADSFAFERRSFGQPVMESEVIALVQGVAGVVYVDLESLQFAPKPKNLLPVVNLMPEYRQKQQDIIIKLVKLQILSALPNKLQTLSALSNQLLTLSTSPDSVQIILL